MINTLGHNDTDYMNVTKWVAGTTLQRLSLVPKPTIDEIIECGGIARWNGELDCDNCGMVWMKYEAIPTAGRGVRLINHSLKRAYDLGSMSEAREYVRSM